MSCEELKDCVEVFMLSHTLISTIENAKEIAAHEGVHSEFAVKSKLAFDKGLLLVTKMLERIDELTLRDDAAE